MSSISSDYTTSTISTTSTDTTSTSSTSDIDLDDVYSEVAAISEIEGETDIEEVSLKLDALEQLLTLDEPTSTLIASAADLMLRIALLQDALAQLCQELSSIQIDQRLNESETANEDQLEYIQEQVKKAIEAQAKQEKAEKKGNVVSCVSNWVQTAISFASTAFMAVSAVGMFMSGNMVGAAAMGVAATAMFAAGVCQLTLAIDASIVAAGGNSALSDGDRARLQQAAMICGCIAAGAALVAGLATVVVAIQQASAAASTSLISSGMTASTNATQQAAATAVKEAMKQIMLELANRSLAAGCQVAGQAAAYAAAYPIMAAMAQFAVATVVIGAMQATNSITTGAVEEEVANIYDAAAEAQRESDEAAADAEALEAIITLIQNMIEQLQTQLEEMCESSANTMTTILDALEGSADTQTQLVNHAFA